MGFTYSARAIGLLAWLALGAGGCAWALPPLRASAGVGPHIGRYVRDTHEPGAEPHKDGVATITGRVGVDPLAAFETLTDRQASADAGMLVDWSPVAQETHLGGYLGVSYFAWSKQLNDDCRARVPVRGTVDLLSGSGVGGGITFATGIELACYALGAEGTSSSTGGAAVAFAGEGGVGVHVTTGARRLDGAQYFVSTLDVVLLVPANAAAAAAAPW